ncbi:hypothetical protein N7449_005040 [Penicillium cf. viridicatum]|uniref:Uncharacterized protein n=1 Tax=Penicillium cf. viridicatum TaxID=2972119 RepID=A0A9W9MKC9_9EURO|nr:hypothetical protein N7449_005040 [Penicillium cf. viridicatum]
MMLISLAPTTEDIRPPCTSARVTALCRLFFPVLPPENVISPVYKLMNEGEPLTSHESAPEATAPPLVVCASHGLHTITGPVASDHAAYPR